MTLWEKICQLFIVYPSDLTGVAKVTAAGETTRAALAEYPVADCCMTRATSVTWEQVRKMLSGVQSYSRIPLILTCDEEGGTGEPLDGHHRHHPDRPHAGL